MQLKANTLSPHTGDSITLTVSGAQPGDKLDLFLATGYWPLLGLPVPDTQIDSTLADSTGWATFIRKVSQPGAFTFYVHARCGLWDLICDTTNYVKVTVTDPVPSPSPTPPPGTCTSGEQYCYNNKLYRCVNGQFIEISSCAPPAPSPTPSPTTPGDEEFNFMTWFNENWPSVVGVLIAFIALIFMIRRGGSD